jgi:hypothetical protein
MWDNHPMCEARFYDLYAGADDGFGNIIWPRGYNMGMACIFMSIDLSFH